MGMRKAHNEHKMVSSEEIVLLHMPYETLIFAELRLRYEREQHTAMSTAIAATTCKRASLDYTQAPKTRIEATCTPMNILKNAETQFST